MKKILFFLFALFLFNKVYALTCFINQNSFDSTIGSDIQNNYITDYYYHNVNILNNPGRYMYFDGIISDDPKFRNGGFLNLDEFKVIGGKNSYLIGINSYFTSTYTELDVTTIDVNEKNGYKKISLNNDCNYVRITEYVNPIVEVTGKGTYSDPWIFDNTRSYVSPTIFLDSNENTTYSKGHSILVTINDSDSLLSNTLKVSYGWSNSATEEPLSYTSVTINSINAKTSTFYASSSNTLTGSYYLWIKPDSVCDSDGNCTNELVKSTGLFYFDNTGPSCVISGNQNGSYINLTLSNVVDEHSGVDTSSFKYSFNNSVYSDISSYISNTAGSIPISGQVSDSLGNISNCNDTYNIQFTSLLSKIMENPQKADSGIVFAKSSSEDNSSGLYYTTNSSRTEGGIRVYYFRGKVENNYVLFGGFCWRIVRTVEDGSIRLRYGGVPLNGACPKTGTNVNIGFASYNSSENGKKPDNARVGYMIGTLKASTPSKSNSNTSDSYIKKIIDKWYESNLLQYSDYIADTPYCNDRSVSTKGSIKIWGGTYSLYGNGSGFNSNKVNYENGTIYAGARRLATNGLNGQETGSLKANPTYVCLNFNDKFTVSSSIGNGKLKYPIALLTSDEISFAGKAFGKKNPTYFLDTGKWYWSLTPMCAGWHKGYTAQCYFNIGTLDIKYNSKSPRFDYPNYIVPAISLKENVLVISGNGNYNSPYIINTNQ